MSDNQDYSAWIGRTEESHDVITPGPLDRLAMMLDHDNPPYKMGDVAPPLAQWMFFLTSSRMSDNGTDGHPRRGGFLPPVHTLPRRMWAGSRLTFPGQLHVGDAIVKRSTIKEVKHKNGAGGPLVFVTVRHEIGRANEAPAIIDDHDIVYRGLEAPAVKASPPSTEIGAWHRTHVPDPVQLFRYSALTFNSHRIHYDRDYATKQEGYPGLIVHGPLIATLLLDLVLTRAPSARIEAFSFRAMSPLFDGNSMSVNATLPGRDGTLKLWAANAEGNLAMAAEATLANFAGEA